MYELSSLRTARKVISVFANVNINESPSLLQTSVLTYKDSDEKLSEILSKIAKKFEEISYEHNDYCYISVVKSGGNPKIWYFYDEQDKLIREDNKILNKTIPLSKLKAV